MQVNERDSDEREHINRSNSDGISKREEKGSEGIEAELPKRTVQHSEGKRQELPRRTVSRSEGSTSGIQKSRGAEPLHRTPDRTEGMASDMRERKAVPPVQYRRTAAKGISAQRKHTVQKLSGLRAKGADMRGLSERGEDSSSQTQKSGARRAGGSVDWNKEIRRSAGIAGKVCLKILSYVMNIFLTLMLIGIIAGTIMGCAFLYYINNYVDGSIDDFDMYMSEQEASTSVYYMDWEDRQSGIGTPVEIVDQRLYAKENRMIVSYNQVPKYLIDAYVSTEDHRFWDHEGVDWIRTIRAAFNYFLGSSSFGGASTITQQVVKNLTEYDDITIQRKVQEIMCALNLEDAKDKTEIMELYLNLVYCSRGCYGVQSAAYVYFGKDVSELSLVECVAIAGITQAPTKYDPVSNPENNKLKRQKMLDNMLQYGYISQEEHDEAYDAELVLNYNKNNANTSSGSNVFTWYMEAVFDEANELLQQEKGLSYKAAQQYIYTGGLQIITAMDPQIQNILEEYYENDANFPRVNDSGVQPESSMVIIDPYTGDIVGLVGGRGRKTQNLIENCATETLRSPGSSIKPISVYAPALDNGVINYASVIDDSPVNFGEVTTDENGNKVYSRPDGYPQNYSNTYRGLTTIDYAVTNSLNTVAYKVLDMLTLDRSFDFVKNKLHMNSMIESLTTKSGSVLSDKDYSALALGGMNYGVTLLEMTAAYQIFPNSGVYNTPHTVLQIKDKSGEIIVDRGIESEVVISDQTATIMTKLLQNVVRRGTASSVTLKNRVDVAGKTGTTTDDRDRWFIGYTPYYVAGVWFGYKMPQSLSAFSASVPPSAKIWDDVMNKVQDIIAERCTNKGEALKSFVDAPGIIECNYCIDSGKVYGDACRNDPRGGRVATGYFTLATMPSDPCDVHVMVPYDGSSGVANTGCKTNKKVALLNIPTRSFPIQVRITDAQYTWRDIGSGDFCTDPSLPFYAATLAPGTYTGISGGVQFNRGCPDHGKAAETTEAQTEAASEPETDGTADTKKPDAGSSADTKKPEKTDKPAA